MTIEESIELIADALSEVYSGATTTEAMALLDKLADRGLYVVLDIDDKRSLIMISGSGYERRDTTFTTLSHILGADEEG